MFEILCLGPQNMLCSISPYFSVLGLETGIKFIFPKGISYCCHSFNQSSFNQTHQRIAIKFVKNVIELITMLVMVCLFQHVDVRCYPLNNAVAVVLMRLNGFVCIKVYYR